MKATTRDQYGPPRVLRIEDIPKPKPAANELLIRVHCTTVNRTDCGILTGKPFPIRLFTGLTKPTSRVPGTDFAGQVVDVGNNVKLFNAGDRVWGLHDEGLASHAEYMTIGENQAVVTIPDNVSYREAAASAEGAHYAYNFMNKISLNPGDKVLVNGATGAIGSALLQMLKSEGLYVTAVGNTKNMELLQSLGADRTHNYENVDFTEVDQEKYRGVLDAVGKSSFRKCQKLLLPRGVYVSSELGVGAENVYLPLITKLRGGARVIFPIPSDCKRSLHYVRNLLVQGKFKPVIDRCYPPEQIREAYDYVQSGQKTGNVVINFSSNQPKQA